MSLKWKLIPAVALTILVGVIFLSATPAQACMSCNCYEPGWGCYPCPPSPTLDEIEISFPEPGKAILKIPGYATTHLLPGGGCVTSMPQIPGIAGVEQVVNFDSRTQLPFSEVSFSIIEGPGEKIPDFLAGEGYEVYQNGPWSAFKSNIVASVEDGVPNHFVIVLQLSDSIEPIEFVRLLHEHGAFLTASAGDDGLPDGGHTYYKPFRSFPMKVTFPGQDPVAAPLDTVISD